MSRSRVPYPKAIKRYPEIRQSILSAYDLCALEASFDLSYRKGWSSHPQARGTTFHRFAAKALREMNRAREGKIEVDVALAILHEVLRQQDVDRVCPHCGSMEIQRGIVDGFRTCRDGHRFETEFVNVPMHEVKDLVWVVKKWATENEFSILNLVDVEHRLRATLAYPNPFGGFVERTVTGQLDAMLVEGSKDDHAIVQDWKDTWGMPSPTELSFEGYFQQRCYAWLIFKQPEFRSIEKVTLREFYVRYSEPREATIWRSSVDDIEEELGALVERFDRSVQESMWSPSPGKHCGYCPRPNSCPIPPFVRGAGKITTEHDAAESARRLIVAEAITKQEKEALAAYVGQNGPQPIKDAKGERVWGYREAKRTSRPTREQMEQALREGSVNLDSLYKETTVTRFEPHVPAKVKETEADAKLLAQLHEAVADARSQHAA